MTCDIVVGVDESAASERALDRGLVEAEQTGRRVRLVHAWSPGVVLGAPPGFAPLDPVARRRMAGHAQRVVDRVLAKGLSRRTSDRPVTVCAQAEVGDPGRELVIASADAALLVVGGKGRGSLASAVVGSATGYAVHHAACPVMVVPADGPPADRFRQVVVGLDGAACSRSALTWALGAADRSRCPLLVVHCWTGDRLRPGLPDHAVSGTQDAAARWLEHQVAQLVPPEARGHVRSAVVHGVAARELLEQTGPDDLLVVGSRGNGGLSSLLLGSTATQCVQQAGSSVVVVRAGAASGQ